MFLAQKSMVGKVVLQVFLNGLLGGEVGFRDQIESGFFSNAETMPPFLENGGAAPGRFLSGFQAND